MRSLNKISNSTQGGKAPKLVITLHFSESKLVSYRLSGNLKSRFPFSSKKIMGMLDIYIGQEKSDLDCYKAQRLFSSFLQVQPEHLTIITITTEEYNRSSDTPYFPGWWRRPWFRTGDDSQ